MSLEECKLMAEAKREMKKEIQKEILRSRGVVDDEDVEICLSIIPVEWPGFGTRNRWVVIVSAYGEISSEYFGRKDLAGKYFAGLTQKYGLKEEEK